ncbi:hypothetical protein BH24ACI2_BH24ACI2_08760 [soil metagenome]
MQSSRKQFAPSVFSISFDENRFLQRFLLERRLRRLPVWLEIMAKEKPVLSYRTKVQDAMKIVRMADDIDLTGNGKWKIKTFH